MTHTVRYLDMEMEDTVKEKDLLQMASSTPQMLPSTKDLFKALLRSMLLSRRKEETK